MMVFSCTDFTHKIPSLLLGNRQQIHQVLNLYRSISVYIHEIKNFNQLRFFDVMLKIHRRPKEFIVVNVTTIVNILVGDQMSKFRLMCAHMLFQTPKKKGGPQKLK